MKTVEVKKKQVSDFLLDLSYLLAKERSCQGDAAMVSIEVIQEMLDKLGLQSLEECIGEAHSNGHIDNCSSCAPLWHFVPVEVKIR